jgi:hypothetical protein
VFRGSHAPKKNHDEEDTIYDRTFECSQVPEVSF